MTMVVGFELDTNKDGLAVTAHGGKYKLAYDVLIRRDDLVHRFHRLSDRGSG